MLSNGSGVKRSAAEALGDEIPSGKKSKQSSKDDDDDVILVHDAGDGAILIDDD